uniref:Uncharacterized protein n=1 Tax=Rhizophora mucronata TaxID=61149 RepID=A0A2P2LBC4_RHIMU
MFHDHFKLKQQVRYELKLKQKMKKKIHFKHTFIFLLELASKMPFHKGCFPCRGAKF